MRTIETNVCTFSELSESAKDKAREWLRNDPYLYAWSDDSLASIQAFCEKFGVTLEDWNIGPWSQIDYKTNATNAHFRGLKLKTVNPEECPTGYCLDFTLSEVFHREFKRTGDALHSFNAAIYEGFKEWRNDWEYAYSDYAIDELMDINGYEFTEEGEKI